MIRQNRARSFGLLCVIASALSCADDTETLGPKPTGEPFERYDEVPVTGKVEINGLAGRVDVVRDKYGMIHIRAGSLADALRVQGYQVARDRTAQLELIRRSATGRMAEAFGDISEGALIDSDIAIRTVGLARVARETVAKLPPETKALVDAYADGISQFNARVVNGEEELPAGMIGLPQTAFQPWTAEDVLAVARFQAFNLGYQANEELDLTELVVAAQKAFGAPKQGEPDTRTEAAKKRENYLYDVVRFKPLVDATPLEAFPNDVSNTMSAKTRNAPALPTRKGLSARTLPSAEALMTTRAFRNAIDAVRKVVGDHQTGTTGSNNWVVARTKSASGNALLASDPHLALSAPATFWMVHVTVDGTAPPQDRQDYAGLSFPGIPGIILGFNQNVAWAATTADYDVTDVYREKVTGDGNGVEFKQQPVAFQKIRETINIAGGKKVDYDVLIVPHHGPIIPTIKPDHTVAPPSGEAFSVKWTGHTPTKDVEAIFGLLSAKNVEDARKSLNDFAVGAQNWVVADSNGEIFYTSHAAIPKRMEGARNWDADKFSGNIPCMVLPGESGNAEWTGAMIEDGYIPHVKNPAKGYLATANTDQIGTTKNNDPTSARLPNGENGYLGCWHDVGFRLKRIQTLIEEKAGANAGDKPSGLDLASMAQIQADVHSATGEQLVEHVVEAGSKLLGGSTGKDPIPADLTALAADPRLQDADPAKPVNKNRFRQMLAYLRIWKETGGLNALSGMNPDNTPSEDKLQTQSSVATAIFNVWMVRMWHLTFDDEVKVLGSNGGLDWRKQLITLMTKQKATDPVDKLKTGAEIFDDMTTPEVETVDQLTVRALLDAADYLDKRLPRADASKPIDIDNWRWGKLHTLRFRALVGLWNSLSIPPVPDEQFPNGFPRGGDGYNVDVAGYPLPATLDPDPTKTSFAYGHGPTQRLVVEMTPTGPIARNVLPGGNVWDSRSDHFRDDAERWRRNENRPVPFSSRDVVQSAEGRVVYRSPGR